MPAVHSVTPAAVVGNGPWSACSSPWSSSPFFRPGTTPSILKPQAGSHNGAPAAEQQAYGAACSEYQSQLNLASTMYKQDHNDRPPHSFDDLKKSGATDDIIRAPGCQFQLDPATGTVTEIGHGQAAPECPPIVSALLHAAACASPPPGGPWFRRPCERSRRSGRPAPAPAGLRCRPVRAASRHSGGDDGQNSSSSPAQELPGVLTLCSKKS